MEIVPINNVIIRKNSMSPRCKICFEPSNEENGELISPCACDGSIKYVHKTCLNEWRFSNVNSESKLKCEICKRPYIIKKMFEDEIFYFNIYNAKKFNILLLYFVYILSCFLFSFLIFLIDAQTNYTSYTIISFKTKIDTKLIEMIDTISGGYFLLYYFSFSGYIINLIFHILALVLPNIYIKRKKIYFKKMWYKNLILFFQGIHFQLLGPLYNSSNFRKDMFFLQIFLGFIMTLFLNFPLYLLHIYLNDLVIKEINEKLNEVDIINCNYNPLYQNINDISENKISTNNIVVRTNLFQTPEHIAIDIVNSSNIINSPRRRLANRRSPRNRTLDIPHPPSYPPPPPPPTSPPGI